MKKLLILICAACVWSVALAKAPVLRFNKQGKFKITQFTDMHIDLGTPERSAEAVKTLAQMRQVLDAEKPDLVAFTGDIVTGKPASEGWHRVLREVSERNIPFCVVLGNHDPEQELTREQIAQLVTSYPTTLNTSLCGQLDDVAIEVLGTKPERPARVLYFLDSNDYSTIEGVDGYGWFRQEQIDWYRNRSAAYKAANGGKPIDAMAFFHIALPEYTTAWRNKKNSRTGRAAEDECPGAVNAGMFAAMVECGDVAGVFVGHDHDIDYVVAEQGIALGYGRFSGDHTTYHSLLPGIRSIELTEGERGFRTWIRERDERVVDHVQFEKGKIQKIK